MCPETLKMLSQEILGREDDRLAEFRKRRREEAQQRAVLRGCGGRIFPHTENRDVVASALQAVAVTCKKALPEELDNDSDPVLVYAFVSRAISAYGAEKFQQGRDAALAETDNNLPRDLKLELAEIHAKLAKYLR